MHYFERILTKYFRKLRTEGLMPGGQQGSLGVEFGSHVLGNLGQGFSTEKCKFY